MMPLDRTRIHRLVCLVVLLLCVTFPQASGAAPKDRQPLPDPMGYVSDHAGVVEADWKARIRSVCQDLERKTGIEMVVVTVKSLSPYRSANDYASAIYQRWGVGSAQQEHGIVILAAIEEQGAAVTVGKGLIGRLTHTQVQEAGQQYLDPAFRDARYGEGLYRTTVALASGLQDVRVGEPSRRHMKGVGVVLTILTAIGAFAFLWWISRPDLRHPFRRLHRGQFWGSGQGVYGGNFGGFGGSTSGDGLT